MKVTVIGGTGLVGAAVVKELASRGHLVKVIARNVDKVLKDNHVTAVQGDVNEADFGTKLEGADAIVSAFNGNGYSDGEAWKKGADNIMAAVKQVNPKFILFVGGAGSLYVGAGKQLVDTPEFPAAIFPTSNEARNLLKTLEEEKSLNWSMICPPAAFAGGEISFERSGKYRLGDNDVLFDANGAPADISVADLAVAIVDEIEKQQHAKRRFTVAAI